ncbi:MAG: aspartyl protease family protein [Armatimonadetes bacterium]|nr:aspartyl protease family protein [Armatimonadota bacterium]
MQLSLKYDLPFVTATLAYNGTTLEIPNVLVDTGSAGTVFAVDIVRTVHISPVAEDVLHSVRGFGGSEVVFTRQVDCLCVGERRLLDFEIEVGGMDYGFDINGILGMDFLIRAGAMIN